jgi:hypothetical protein
MEPSEANTNEKYKKSVLIVKSFSAFILLVSNILA